MAALVERLLRSSLLACSFFPALAHAQDSALQRIQSVESSTSEVRPVIEATHTRLVFDRDVVRVAIGRGQTLSAEILNSRELLVLGQQNGRTSLFVWFADGTTETFFFTVQPDLTVLRAALAEIHPSIEAELAPDRDALVLRARPKTRTAPC